MTTRIFVLKNSYQMKHQEVADEILRQLEEWRPSDNTASKSPLCVRSGLFSIQPVLFFFHHYLDKPEFVFTFENTFILLQFCPVYQFRLFQRQVPATRWCFPCNPFCVLRRSILLQRGRRRYRESVSGSQLPFCSLFR